MIEQRILRTVTLAAFCLCLAVGPALAGDTNANAGTSAFSFLKINIGARPVAMGGAFTGVADDESSLYYNPAGITSFEQSRYILGYHNYFEDLQSGFIGYIKPLDDQKALAFYASYLNYGDFPETDMLGNVTGTFGGGDMLIAATFAIRQTHQFSVGITGKFIHEKIQDYSSSGVAFDLGVRYTSDRGRLVGGLMLQNFGTQLSTFAAEEKDDLPTVLRGGVSVRPRHLPFVFAGDFIMPFDNDLDFALGAEYRELEYLLLRMGWNSFGSNYKAADSDGGLAGFAMGVGIKLKSMEASYAFAPGADLGDSHRITLTGGI